MATVNPQQATIDRNRALAMALQAQGMQPLQSPNVRGARTSPWEGVNKIAQSLMGGYQNQQLDQQQAALTGQENAAASARTKALVQALMDPKTDPAKASAIVEALNAGDPAANIGLESILPQAPQPGFTIGEGQTRFDAQGNPIANVPAKPPAPPAPAAGFTLAPGQQRFNADGTPIANVPALEPTPKPEPTVSLQAKEIIGPKGEPVFANFNSTTGKYLNPDTGEVIPGARPYVAPKSSSNPASERRIDNLRTKFSGEPIVKKYNVVTDALQFVKTIPDENKNPAYDQALIYAFAKAMDPDSVVREGEYATVQKYAQSWADNFKFNAQRVLANTEFLSAEARKNMKKVIEERVKPVVSQYGNLRRSYGVQVNGITGEKDGETYLIDYGSAFEAPTGGGLKVGDVEDGYIYQGGDKADPKNWKKK